MNKLTRIFTGSLVAAFLFSGVSAIPAMAQDAAKSAAAQDTLKAASKALYAALSTLDMTTTEKAWAHKPYVAYISPSTKTIVVGWDAVKTAMAEINQTYSQREVSLVESHLQIQGKLAWEVGTEKAHITLKNGEVRDFNTFVTNVYENQNGRWLVVSHHAQPIPK